MFILRRQSVPFFSRKSPVIPLLSDKVGKDRDTGERVKMLSDGKRQNRVCCGGNDEVFGCMRIFIGVRGVLWRLRIERNKLTLAC